MTARYLTLRQPWSSLVMGGAKDVENRSWKVPSTLPLWQKCVVCAARWDAAGSRCVPAAKGALTCGDADRRCKVYPDGLLPFRLWIHAGLGWDDGIAVWQCRLCAAMTEDIGRDEFGCPGDVDEGTHDWFPVHRRVVPRGVLLGSVSVTGCHQSHECWTPCDCNGVVHPCEHERWCSPWAERASDIWHWTLADPQPLPEPVPMRGGQGLRFLPDDVAEQVRAQGVSV